MKPDLSNVIDDSLSYYGVMYRAYSDDKEARKHISRQVQETVRCLKADTKTKIELLYKFMKIRR